ncbi:hypothetical protein E3N88_34445 [Mikania micrantha]|uniref:Retrotransposon gag domain-containing protein n=1 Tax=Mikania micrantha TaxID=192012 RepID=A0A5N6LY57_9ASTR|nr:hypothetical protein E3N88_34445 [Mikania micrantha]
MCDDSTEDQPVSLRAAHLTEGPYLIDNKPGADDNPRSTITKESGKKGTVLTEGVVDPRVTVSEESEEEEPEMTITPDFVKNNREVLRARLAELEHHEKLEKLKVDELRHKFLKQFHQKKKVVKNPNEILHIRRRDDEKVEQFMERCITKSMQIQGVPEVMKISSFINGVRQPQLCEKLGEDFPATFDSLMDKVRAFVRGKDTSFRAREWELKKWELSFKGDTRDYQEWTLRRER